MTPGERFLQAGDFLFQHRLDYIRAFRDFRWPVLSEFNWALDYFDAVGRHDERTALWIVEEDGSEEKISFADMSRRSGVQPSKEVAEAILRFARERLSPYQRIRRIEFTDLPKTISGKIRRVQLRAAEREQRLQGGRGTNEFHEEEFE